MQSRQGEFCKGGKMGSLWFLRVSIINAAKTGPDHPCTLQGAALEFNLSQGLIGFVILPIVGNAAEHATALVMSYKGKMDLALSVALGSSTVRVRSSKSIAFISST